MICFLYRAFENFGQALNPCFVEGVARAHAVADENIPNEIGRDVHRLLVGLPYKRKSANSPFDRSRICIHKM